MPIEEPMFMSFMKKSKIILILFLLSCLIQQSTFAQPDEIQGMKEGWIIGLHTGIYFANSYTANYYNGTESNENNISFVLDNQYRRNEILDYFDATTYTYSQEDLPKNMEYAPEMNIGFLIRNNITEDWGIFANFNHVKLVAKGNFILEFDPNEIATEDDNRVFKIYGVEERTNINIGLHRQFNNLSPQITYYGEIGININNTVVEKSAIELGDLNYSIINKYGGNTSYVPGMQQPEYDFRLGGIGFGTFGGMGMKYLFNDKLTVDVGLTSYVKNINLDDYKSFTVHWSPYARIMYNGFFEFL